MPIPNENTHSPAEKPAETALDNKGSFREGSFREVPFDGVTAAGKSAGRGSEKMVV